MYLPLHKLGNAIDVANAVVFALSPAASYVTGSIIMVDGGQTLTAPNFTVLNDDFLKVWKSPVQAKL